MDKLRFEQLLGVSDLPVCPECLDLLKAWAEGNAVTRENADTWKTLKAILQQCPRRHRLAA